MNSTSYAEKLDALAPIRSFDYRAFTPDDRFSSRVCRFVLSLALIHNDFSDVELAILFLRSQLPPGSPRVSRAFGLFNGLALHLSKHKMAILHELLVMIADEKRTAFGLPAFDGLVKKLSKKDRDAWAEIVAAARGNPRRTKLGELLCLCRDKVASHYDVKKIHSAYVATFENGPRPPMLSMGNSALETRFYFADAVVNEVILDEAHREQAADLLMRHNTLLDSVNRALFFIVTTFIQGRGYAWRVVEELE